MSAAMMRPTLLAACLAALFVPPVDGQELRLRRDVPPVAWGGCPAEPAVTPDAAARQAAQRLADAAAQAAILGNEAEALALLGRAAALDPSSPGITYHHARALEEAGQRQDALAAFCRYLALAPASPDAAEVRGRVDELTRVEGGMPGPAVEAFRAGIAAFDARRLVEAEAAFAAAAEAAPGWADPAYNRGAVRLAQGSLQPAAADLRRYLELSPGAPDFDDVLDVVAMIRAVDPGNANGALLAGLLVPGLGHFTTDRPVAGLLVLGASGGALAAAFLVQRTELDCLGVPVDGRCPPDQVQNERTVRPLQAAGIAVAAAIAVVGAVEARHVVSRRNRAAALPIRVTGGVPIPELRVAHDGLRLALRLSF